MRKFAYLKEPLKHDGGGDTVKIMLYKTEDGAYLFEYDGRNDLQCTCDLFYDSLDDLYEEWDGRIDERGWIAIEDPQTGCQHDAFLPLRVKGRETGKPEHGKFEMLKSGEWIDLPEHFNKELEGRPLEEQAGHYRIRIKTTIDKYSYGEHTSSRSREETYRLEDCSDVKGLIVKDGSFAGVLIRSWHGEARACLPGECVTVYYASDDDGPGSASREDVACLVCTGSEEE